MGNDGVSFMSILGTIVHLIMRINYIYSKPGRSCTKHFIVYLLNTRRPERTWTLVADDTLNCLYFDSNSNYFITLGLWFKYQHRLRQRLGLEWARNHYLNQWWLRSLTPYTIHYIKWVKAKLLLIVSGLEKITNIFAHSILLELLSKFH